MITTKGGFTFCGVDIEDIGLTYAPENKDTYVYAPGIANIHEETFEGHDGGYAYGTYKEPKVFTLRCFYEETNIASGLMAKIHSLFKVGKSGLLIFKRRPWCYYYCTVTDTNADDMRNYMNGLVVITMKAYYPYARGVEINGRLFSNLRADPYHEEIMQNTALMDRDELVPPCTFTDIFYSNTNNVKEINLLNPGTERAKVGLVISGTAGDGVTIYNKTTDQICRYVAFDTESPSANYDYIYTDGFNGKTIQDTGTDPFEPTNFRKLAFLYHDYGFIELEPAYPIKRNIFATYNHDTITTTNILYDNSFEQEWYKDKYIYLDAWYRIQRCEDKHTLIIYPRNANVLPITQRNIERQAQGESFDAYPDSGSIQTTISALNVIEITPTQNSLLTRLNFIYKPTFA